MTIKTPPQIDEFKSSFGVNSEIPDPVDLKATKRPADQDNGDKSTPKTTKSEMIASLVKKAYSMSRDDLTTLHADVMNQKTLAPGSKLKEPMPTLSMKEDLQIVFGDETLSEEFVNRASTLFEAAVHAKIVEETSRLEEEFEAKLEEAITISTNEISESVSKYVDYVVSEWMEENKLAIGQGVRNEISESFMEGLRNLFVEHYIEIPENKVDVIESMVEKIATLESRLNESIDDNITLSEEIRRRDADVIVDDISEGLTDAQSDRFKTLVESVHFSNPDEFKEKLNTIKESFLGHKKSESTISAKQQLSEAVEIDDATVGTQVTDPSISAYVETISRIAKR